MKIDTWASIRHLFFAEKLPKKAIARKLGLDPKTIRRALKKETFSTACSQNRASKLDPFKDKIQTLLETYPGLSGVRIHQEIQTLGYSGGISILRDYLRTIQPPSQAFLPIRALPAEEAQADWAYAGRISSQRVYCFLITLSFSGMLYLEFFPLSVLKTSSSATFTPFIILEASPKGSGTIIYRASFCTDSTAASISIPASSILARTIFLSLLPAM